MSIYKIALILTSSNIVIYEYITYVIGLSVMVYII